MSRYISKTMKADVRARARDRCESCGAREKPTYMEVDHVTPYSIGGTTTFDNLQLLCRKCNLKKGSQALKCVRCGEKNLHTAKFCQSCKNPIRKADREDFGWIPGKGFDLRRTILLTIAILMIVYGLYNMLINGNTH